MGFWRFLAAAALLAAMSVYGGYLYISGELEYLKIYVPSVDNITSYNDEIKLTVFGANGLEMYKHYYRRSGKLPEGYDISRLTFMADRLMDGKRSQPRSYGIERWKLFLIKQRGIDPFSLKGVVLNHYADALLAENKLTGFRGEVVRWYTLARLRDVYSRDELYKIYLDAPSYGNDVYGIAAASEYYLGKPIENASLLETAFLTAILSGDKPLDPVKDFIYLDKYARVALRGLYEAGRVSLEEYSAEASGLVRVNLPEYPVIEPSYVEEVLKIIASDKRFPVGRESLRIYTGYNKHASDIVRAVLEESLADKDPALQMSFVLVNRQTQSVEAAVGSRAPESRRNRAVSLKRQMASTFKPIVYMTAFERGFKPSDHIMDKPYSFNSGKFIYSPRNYENYFMGDIPIRYGLVHSLNNATVRLAEMTGLGRVKNMAVGIGMKSAVMPFHAMALGSFAATPLNVAQMYSTIGNYGERKLPAMILRVETGGGRVYDMRELPERAVSEAAAFQTLYIMQDVVKKGTARKAGLFPGTAAKTGTSDKFRDGWTVALFGPYVAVCWAGYDDYRSMGSGNAGGIIAAPVIGKFQREYFDNGTVFTLPPPEDIELRRVSAVSGLLTDREIKSSYIEAYRKGALPKKEKVTKKK